MSVDRIISKLDAPFMTNRMQTLERARRLLRRKPAEETTSSQAAKQAGSKVWNSKFEGNGIFGKFGTGLG